MSGTRTTVPMLPLDSSVSRTGVGRRPTLYLYGIKIMFVYSKRFPLFLYDTLGVLPVGWFESTRSFQRTLPTEDSTLDLLLILHLCKPSALW